MDRTINNKQEEKTLVLGATTKPDRYAFLAVTKLQKNGFSVVAVGNKTGDINGLTIKTNPPNDLSIHTVTIYLSAKNQEQYYSYLQNLPAKRYIFNPGAENTELENLLAKQGKEVMNACTLVLLSTDQF